jgi:hypothetical protein
MFTWYKKIFFDPIILRLDKIERRLEMTAKLTDLDAAIAAEKTLIGNSLVEVITKIDADYVALLAKVAPADVDYQSEVDAIQANTAAITAAITSVQSSDPAPVGTPSDGTVAPSA